MIQPGDILDIQIKGLNPESTLVFQPNPSNSQAQANFNTRLIDGYLVGEEGDIRLPILGQMNTTGITTDSLASKLVKDLSPYVKNPSVNIRVLNFRISVLGEVNQPGTFTVLDEQISIPQALGLAGDLSINGDRNKVLLVRNNNGKQTSYTLDLTSSDFMNSPYYYLKQEETFKIFFVLHNIFFNIVLVWWKRTTVYLFSILSFETISFKSVLFFDNIDFIFRGKYDD